MPASDLISRAARFFVLAEQVYRLGYWPDALLWGLSAPLVVETAEHLPAMAAVVRKVVYWFPPYTLTYIFRRVASCPLPGVLPPETVPWHNQLVAAWEVHRASGHVNRQNFARLALVRLDGCGMPDGQARPSRLPEWLAEARKMASGRGNRPVACTGEGQPDGRPYQELEALAALASWRPAPRVITPPETLREWVKFWLEMRQSADPVEKGIAAIAILNLPEADLRAASIPPVPVVELLRQLTTAIQAAAERTYEKENNYLFLLDWQPVKGTTWPVAEVGKIARTWLEVTKHKNWCHRCTAWRQLIRWDRAGSLDICGIDLLSELVKAVPTETDEVVLREMAQWVPGAERFTTTGTPGRCSQRWQLERAWERHRTSGNFYKRASAWLAGIRLDQAGLFSEPPEGFLDVYISHLAEEWDNDVLFILAHWSPGAGVPGMWHQKWKEGWQQRLLDENERIRQIAVYTFLRQFLEGGHGRSLRDGPLTLWRAGVKVSPEAKHILDAAFARLQEVRARLAAGEVPDFEKVPVPPAERHRPPLALPPGRIAGREWQMENEKLKMENEGMKHQKATPQPNPRLVPDRPSR